MFSSRLDFSLLQLVLLRVRHHWSPGHNKLSLSAFRIGICNSKTSKKSVFYRKLLKVQEITEFVMYL